MRGTNRSSAALLASVLAVSAALPAPLTGQRVGVQTHERGWVGISYTIQPSLNGDVSVVITEVNAGSPAERAGIEVGDFLVSLNGQGVGTNFGDIPWLIRPGDPVQVVVSREGRQRQVRVVAMERPPELRSRAAVSLTVTTDSMEASMFRAMDSLRLTLVTPQGQEVRVLGVPARVESRVRVVEPGEATLVLEHDLEGDASALGHFSLRTDEVLPELALEEVRAPFGFWVFRAPGQDTLRRAIEAFNREIREFRVREADRLPLLVDAAVDTPAASDDELVGLRRVLKSFADRSVVLRQAIDRATREAAQPRAGYATAWRIPEESDEPERQGGTLFGPLTPYALGQNLAAGAEVVDLKPELADYFQVVGGVLVVDVLPETPSARAGIRPGDVITHVGDLNIRSLSELRLGLARAGDRLPITVVRRGESLQVVLQR